MECGYGAYVDLMKRYPLVTDAFLQLKPGYQKVRSGLSHDGLWSTECSASTTGKRSAVNIKPAY